jgi:hypothetical protein
MTYSAFYVAEFPAFGYFPNNVLSGYSLCGASNRHRLSALFRCAAQGNQKNRPGRSMHEVNDAQWLAFEALAKTYPNDNGVRLTADLARWLVEEYQRQKLPVAPIVQRVLHTVTQELQSFSSRAAGPNQLASYQVIFRCDRRPVREVARLSRKWLLLGKIRSARLRRWLHLRGNQALVKNRSCLH